jgi:hypothetical protein
MSGGARVGVRETPAAVCGCSDISYFQTNEEQCSIVLLVELLVPE